LEPSNRGNVDLTPPTRRTVVLETVVGIAAYGPGLAAVTVLDPVVPRAAAILGGALVWLVAYPVVYLAVFQRRPDFFARRPWRYSLPNAAGLIGALAVTWSGLETTTTFAIAIPLVIAGQTFSQLWWSPSSGDATTAPV
jgi:hypothetical protein